MHSFGCGIFKISRSRERRLFSFANVHYISSFVSRILGKRTSEFKLKFSFKPLGEILKEMNIIILIILIILIVLSIVLFKSNKKTEEGIVFKLYEIPELVNNSTLKFHLQNLKSAIRNKNINLASLTYAKIIEAVRQENASNDNKYSILLTELKTDYKNFLETFNLEYPENFLSPWERKRIKDGKEITEIDPKYEKILDIHFELNHQISSYYKDREIEDNLEKAIDACKKQIELAEKAKQAFVILYDDENLPHHKGFSQLAIILEKQNKKEECIKICEIAKMQGWNDDWDNRINRLQKKLNK
jgi:hypothetical protein